MKAELIIPTAGISNLEELRYGIEKLLQYSDGLFEDDRDYAYIERFLANTLEVLNDRQ